VTGILGSGLIAVGLVWGGFLAFLASNLFLAGFAVRRQANGILAMQLVYTATSLYGLYRWWGT